MGIQYVKCPRCYQTVIPIDPSEGYQILRCSGCGKTLEYDGTQVNAFTWEERAEMAAKAAAEEAAKTDEELREIEKFLRKERRKTCFKAFIIIAEIAFLGWFLYYLLTGQNLLDYLR